MPLLIADMPEIITPYIEANEPVQIASAPGVGKSETIDQMVAAYTEPDGFEWGLCKLFIAALSQVDMYGFLVPGEGPKMQSSHARTPPTTRAPPTRHPR